MIINSTIIATALTLFVSFLVVPIYKKYIKIKYIRRFLKAYIIDYINPLKSLLELHKDDDLYINKSDVDNLIDKEIQQLNYSREHELIFLSDDYSFELIRINSYTLALIGDIKRLGMNYLFNDQTEKYYKYQGILDREILRESIKALNDFHINAKKYYKLKFDKVSLDDSVVKNMVKRYELELGK